MFLVIMNSEDRASARLYADAARRLNSLAVLSVRTPSGVPATSRCTAANAWYSLLDR